MGFYIDMEMPKEGFVEILIRDDGIDYTKAEIKINQDLPEPLQTQALCHEWLHGALVMLGFNNQTQDEQFVQALSAAINMSFKLKEE